MIERAQLFGSHGGLVGVTCEPPGGARPGLPVAVFSNVGLNHHVGPSRTWVELARRLAEAGYASLRFDLSGFGDSEARHDARSDAERAVLDLQEALAFLAQRWGAERFVIVANCSGTDSQHAVMLDDARVVGGVTVDGYAYRNLGYSLRRWVWRFCEPARWRRRARQRRLARSGTGPEAGEAAEVWTRDIPSRERFAADLRRLTARGVRLLLFFTSGADRHYNHAGQFHATFGEREHVEVHFDPRADHLYSAAGERERFCARVVEWMSRRFPPPAGPPGDA